VSNAGFRLAIVFIAALGPAQVAAQGDSASKRVVNFSGFGEVSYSYSTDAAGSAIVGRLYDRFHDQLALDALTLVLDLPYDPKKASGGLHAEALLGQNAAVIKSSGFDVGDQGDVPQLYVTLNLPTGNGNGIQFKAGRMPTLLGLEVIETPANPNWSEGNQFIYVENFTQTGLSVEHKFSDRVDAQLRIFNGWDVVEDNNSHKSFMARIGFAPGGGSSLALLGYLGPEQAGNNDANRYGAEALLGTKFGGATSLWLQGDVGQEDANSALPDPTRAASWWALGAWITRDFSGGLSLALRGDYLDDERGARTSGVLGLPLNTGQRLGSVTATLNVRGWEGMLLRPEVRYDRSNLPAFDNAPDQLTFALSAAYAF